MHNMEELRKDFPMLQKQMNGKPLVYLDSAATSYKPQCVIDAILKFYTEEYATVHRAVYEFATVATDNYSEVRRKVKEFLHAQNEDEIVFTRGATESINIISQCYGRENVKSGDEILITEMEHHANIVPWQLLCEEVGAKLVVVPITDSGEVDLAQYRAKLSPRTKIVSVCHSSNVLGTINPIKEMAQMAHEVGAVMVVDGAQSAARIPVNVVDLEVDFYVCSGHKMYGPTGVGILYGRKEHLEAMAPYHGGGDMIREVTFAKTIYQAPPLKFEAGTPMIAQVLGLGAAIQYLQQIGMENVFAHEKILLESATAKLNEIEGIRIIGTAPEKTGIITFHVNEVHPLDLGTMIAFKGVAMRTGTMCSQPLLRRYGFQTLNRISFGIYNTMDDVQAFIQALNEVVALLNSRT